MPPGCCEDEMTARAQPQRGVGAAIGSARVTSPWWTQPLDCHVRLFAHRLQTKKRQRPTGKPNGRQEASCPRNADSRGLKPLGWTAMAPPALSAEGAWGWDGAWPSSPRDPNQEGPGGPRARCRYPHGPTLTSLSVRRDPGPLRAPAQVTLCHVALEDKAGSLDPSGAGALCDTCASSPPPRPAPAGREPDPISFLGRGGLLGSPFSLLCPTGHRGSRVSPREALSVTQAPPFQALASQVSAAPRAQRHPARVPSSTVPVPSCQAGSGAGLVSNPSPGLPGQMPRPGALATHASVSPSIQRDS